MNIILNFMDKIYGDSKMLSIIYVVGAVLLFIFIILLIFSLRKPDKKEEPKIMEEPKIEEEPKKIEPVIDPKKELIAKETEEKKEEIKPDISEQNIFEKTTIIPLDNINSSANETLTKEENIEKALDNVEKMKLEEVKLTDTKENLSSLSAEIPDVDDFVDDVVKKTYEKNEQFSSVYVGNNTSTIKLDKVMDNLNVDEDVKKVLIPEEDKKEDVSEKTSSIEIPIAKEETDEKVENKIKEEKKLEEPVGLDNLKNALEEKKKEVNSKQDELKAKLSALNTEKNVSNETMKAEDLLNKLNSVKDNK